MKDVGIIRYFLGIQVEQLYKDIFLCQQKYAKNVSNMFRMTNCKPRDTWVVTQKKIKEPISKNNTGSQFV